VINTEKMSNLIISCVTICILLLVNYLRNRQFFIENTSNASRKLHSNSVTRIGGVSLIGFSVVFFYTNSDLIDKVILFSLIVFLIGFLEDIFNTITSSIRLLLIFFVVNLFIFYTNLNLIEIDNSFMNFILSQNYIFSLIFTSTSLILLINGFNFIDGVNGLMLGYTIISVISFLILVQPLNTDLEIFLLSVLIPVSILFLVNFIFGKILSGDGGSYLLGFLIGSICIIMAKDYYINSFAIACMLFYPIIEVVFTFLRRLLKKKNPINPDGFHLHQIIFNLLVIKYNQKNINILNSATSVIILAFLVFTNFFIIFFYNQINFALLYLFLNSLYLIAYLFLFNIYTKIKN